MNTSILRSVFVAAAFVASGNAVFAKDITASTAPESISASTSTLTWSPDVVGLFGAVSIAVGATAPATYGSPVLTSSTSTFSFDDTSNAITALTLNGGATLTLSSAGFAGGPGSVALNNLKLDITTKKVWADVSGANGLAAGNYNIFDVGTIAGSTSFSGAGSYSTSASGLTLTSGGADLLLKGLGLASFVKGTLTSTPTYGALQFNTTVSVATVPEPTTWALMLTGLAAVATMARRRKEV